MTDALDKEGLAKATAACRHITFNALTMDECRDAVKAAITAYLSAPRPDELAEARAKIERLVEDRARFPDRPDDIGRMIGCQFDNLRAAKKSAYEIAHRALTERDALAADKARHEAALRPFADAVGDEESDPDDARRPDAWNIWEMSEAMNITLGHLRAARAALSGASIPAPDKLAEARREALEEAVHGEWREVDTDHPLKGRRRSPAYFPATGETCEVSGPNCDNDKGYTWGVTEVLWQNDIFVLYGNKGFWPVLHKHEHVLFRPVASISTPARREGE